MIYERSFVLRKKEEMKGNSKQHRACLVRQTRIINTLRPRQNGRHFPDDIFKCIFFNENVWISFEISLKCVPKGPINNSPALVQIMAWRRPGDKPLSEPMMVSLLTQICVTRPQWVNILKTSSRPINKSLWSNTEQEMQMYLVCFGIWIKIWKGTMFGKL